MKGILLGFLLALAIAALAGMLFVYSGWVPANADAEPGRMETWAAETSLEATLEREAPKTANPIPLTDENLRSGIRLFAENCSVCHGTAKGDKQASPIAKGLYQKPPQFGSEGVEDDTEGLSFWKVKHGIRLTGMPSFRETLSDQQIWTIALFLKHMDKLPPAASADWQQVKNWPVATAATDDKGLARRLGADERGMRAYVLVVLRTGPTRVPDGEKRKAMFVGHFANMDRLSKEGKLVLAGPFEQSTDGWRGLFLFAVGTVDEARQLVATDPVIVSGEMVADFHPWYGSAAAMMLPEIHERLKP